MPDWYLDEPIVEVGDDFYLTAFWLLSTCRAVGMAEGPIPWTAVQQYAAISQLDSEATKLFTSIITLMDGAYLNWRSKKEGHGTGIPNRRSGRPVKGNKRR